MFGEWTSGKSPVWLKPFKVYLVIPVSPNPDPRKHVSQNNAHLGRHDAVVAPSRRRLHGAGVHSDAVAMFAVVLRWRLVAARRCLFVVQRFPVSKVRVR